MSYAFKTEKTEIRLNSLEMATHNVYKTTGNLERVNSIKSTTTTSVPLLSYFDQD